MKLMVKLKTKEAIIFIIQLPFIYLNIIHVSLSLRKISLSRRVKNKMKVDDHCDIQWRE
jgi:hypothetical protein